MHKLTITPKHLKITQKKKKKIAQTKHQPATTRYKTRPDKADIEHGRGIQRRPLPLNKATSDKHRDYLGS